MKNQHDGKLQLMCNGVEFMIPRRLQGLSILQISRFEARISSVHMTLNEAESLGVNIFQNIYIVTNKTIKIADRFLLPVIIPAVFLVLWEFLAWKGVLRSTILPAPSIIGSTLYDMLVTGELWGHLKTSLWRVIQGFTLGSSCGLIAGLLISTSLRLERSLLLVTGILRPIPIIAWVPVLILWMGIDEASKVTVISIGTFWPVLLNVIQGIRSTDKKHLEVARILGKNRSTILFHVVLPSALPSIFTGLRVGIGIAWMSVIGAELIAASRGLGFLIAYARELSQADVMLVGVACIGVTGLLIDILLRSIEKRLLRWNVNLSGSV